MLRFVLDYAKQTFSVHLSTSKTLYMDKTLATVDSNLIQSALCFLAMIRNDANLHNRLAASRTTVDIPYLVILGAQCGHIFNEAALRKAFVFDWQMRMAQWQISVRSSMPVKFEGMPTAKQPT